jgi:peptidoglycan/LPS O-acetylase OafA/YrhL
MQNVEKAYFPALTGVRALAAYMVFIHHLIPIQWESGVFILGYFFGEFHVGVTFFFVLSGFLIHNRYSKMSELSLYAYGKYFISRVARIMPIFCILTTLTFIYNYYFHRQDAGLLLKNFGLWILNISLFKGFFAGLHFSGIPQSWSLTVEFCFYGIAPFLFYKMKRKRIKIKM